MLDYPSIKISEQAETPARQPSSATHWQLTPDNLPPERYLRRLPWLAGIDENPVFRFHARRRFSAIALLQQYAFVPFMIMPVFLGRLPLLGYLLLLIAGQYLLGKTTRAWQQQRKREQMSPQLLQELYLAGVTPECIVDGLAALPLRRRATRLGWVLRLLLIVLYASLYTLSFSSMRGLLLLFVIAYSSGLPLGFARPAQGYRHAGVIGLQLLQDVQKACGTGIARKSGNLLMTALVVIAFIAAFCAIIFLDTRFVLPSVIDESNWMIALHPRLMSALAVGAALLAGLLWCAISALGRQSIRTAATKTFNQLYDSLHDDRFQLTFGHS
jgi:hypothetical protein